MFLMCAVSRRASLSRFPVDLCPLRFGRWLPAKSRDQAAGICLPRHDGRPVAMKHAKDLPSGASNVRRARIYSEAPTALLGSAIDFPGMELASAQGIPRLLARFRLPVRTAAPVLIMVGDLDVHIPFSNAQEISATLPAA